MSNSSELRSGLPESPSIKRRLCDSIINKNYLPNTKVSVNNFDENHNAVFSSNEQETRKIPTYDLKLKEAFVPLVRLEDVQRVKLSKAAGLMEILNCKEQCLLPINISTKIEPAEIKPAEGVISKKCTSKSPNFVILQNIILREGKKAEHLKKIEPR